MRRRSNTGRSGLWIPFRARSAAMAAWMALLLGGPAALQAQGIPAQAERPVDSLPQAFEAAWSRQPEAHAAASRREAALAQRQAASRWSAGPLSAELAARTDRVANNQGVREYEAGVAVPLWLPGERSRSRLVADAELDALEGRLQAARWRLAGAVRDAYWSRLRAQLDARSAASRLAHAEQLAADVERRTRAGDLSRADLHQAQAAVASAQVEMAEARSALAQATLALRSLVGHPVAPTLPDSPEPLVPGQPLPIEETTHPVLRELADRVELARRNRDLVAVQGRANPEVAVGAVRERDGFGESYGRSLTLGLRLPLGRDPQQGTRLALASAEQTEAEVQLQLERERIQAEIESARTRVENTQVAVRAAERRTALAAEARGFFEKSFRLGETDLPTRLRIELEAAEAERQSARARVEHAQAISRLRQVLGLLPE